MAPFVGRPGARNGSGGSGLGEERWDDERADRLLDGALAVLEAAGGWEGPEEDDQHNDPAKIGLPLLISGV